MQRLNNPDFLEKIWITGIKADRASEVEEIADAIPLQVSQNWTIQVVLGLERRRLVLEGTSAHYLEPYVGN